MSKNKYILPEIVQRKRPEVTSSKTDPYRTVLDRAAPWPFRKMPYAFWSLIFLITTATATAFAWNMPNPRPYFGLCISQAAGFLTVPLVFRFAYFRLSDWALAAQAFIKCGPDNPGVNAEERLEDKIAYFRGTPVMYWVGGIVSGLAIVSFWSSGYPEVGFQSGSKAFSSLMVISSSFIAGMGIFAVLRTCLMLWEVGRCSVRVTKGRFGILLTGRVLVQCYFATAVAWSFYVCSAIIGATDLNSFLLEARTPILVLAIPTLAILFATFVACQIPLHNRMIEFKREELDRIEGILDRLKSSYSENISQELRDRIIFFEKQRDETTALPEWPFTSSALLGAAGSTATIVAPAILSTLVPAIAKASGLIQ